MKKTLLFFSLCLVTLVSLTLWIFLKKDDPLSFDTYIEQRWPVFISEIRSTNTAVFKWTPPNEKPTELLKTELLLPHYQNYPFEDIQNLYSTSQSCLGFPKKTSAELAKAWTWVKSLCFKTPLEKDFFKKPPYLFPSGKSFVQMALDEKLQLGTFLRDDQVIRFQSLTEELAETAFGNELSLQQVQGLLAGEDLLLGQFNVFIKEKSVFENQQEKNYLKVSKIEWDKKIAFEDFNFTDDLNQPCLKKAVHGCWVANKNKNALKLKTLQRILVFADLILVVFALGLYLVYRKRRARLKENQRFTLQLLTHELRTPVTTLGLLLENTRQNYEDLTPSLQINFLKMTTEITRLKNSMQMSYAYLQSDNIGKNKIKINFEPIELNSFVKEILENSEFADIRFEFDPTPLCIEAERFWFVLCLNNLIKNATVHGEAPVSVELTASDDKIRISVTDAGQLKIRLQDLTKPFLKGADSQGLGLGLSIISQIIKEMKAELEIKENPTSFTLIFERIK